jgi:hypothetical protein
MLIGSAFPLHMGYYGWICKGWCVTVRTIVRETKQSVDDPACTEDVTRNILGMRCVARGRKAGHSEAQRNLAVIDHIGMMLSWPLGALGIAAPTVSCALAYVLDNYDGCSVFIRLVLDMYGDHFVRMSSNLLEASVLSYLLLFIGTKSALWHVAASCFALSIVRRWRSGERLKT